MTNKQQLIQEYGLKAVKIALIALAVFLVNPSANAQIEAGTQYQIVALHSNKCVDVSEVSTKSGQAIHQYRCLQADNQRWQFEPKTVGSEVAYTIKARHSGKCLDVERGGTAKGTAVIQWDCNGGNNQLWIPQKVGDGYQLKSVSATGKCLDVAGVSTADGAKMQIWDCLGAAQKNQLFKLPLLTTIANIQFKSYNSVEYSDQPNSSNEYDWLRGPNFTRDVLNPLDGGVVLRYTQDVQGSSDGCSNKFPDLYKAVFRHACFAHDTNFGAPFQMAGFPNYEGDGTSIGRDIADYLFLKDMLYINKQKYGGTNEYSLGESAAYGFFRGVQDFVGFGPAFGYYPGKRGVQTWKEKGGVVAVKNYGGYVARVRVTWTSPRGERKVEEVLNGGGRAAAIPLSIGSRDIDVEITAVGGIKDGGLIVKKTYSKPEMITFTVGGDLFAGWNYLEGGLKASFGDDLRDAFRGKAAPAGQRAIRFNSEGGFAAAMTVLYFVNEKIGGTTVPTLKTQSTPPLTAGFARTLVIPNELSPGTILQVFIRGYGTTKDQVFATTVPIDFKDEPCFKSFGALTFPQGSPC